MHELDFKQGSRDQVLKQIAGNFDCKAQLVFCNAPLPEQSQMNRLRTVRGAVAKTATAEEVLYAAELIAAGKTAFQAPSHESAGKQLSQRQEEVVRLTLQGLTNKAIADALDLKEGTVKAHLSAVYRALGVQNRTQLIVHCSARLP